MRIRQLLLFGLAALSLTSCFKDEAPNAECDITKAWVHIDNWERLFFNVSDTAKNVLYSDANIIFAVKPDSDITALAPMFELTPGATITPSNGSTQDFSRGPVKYTVTSEDGKWSRDYYVSFSLPKIPLEYEFEDCIVYTDVSKATYNKWYEQCETGSNTTAQIEVFANANSGYALSNVKSPVENYPSVSDTGYSGKGVRLTTCSTGAWGELVQRPLAAGNFFIGEFDVSQALKNTLHTTRMGRPFDRKPLKVTGMYKYKTDEVFWRYRDETIEKHPEIKDRAAIYASFYRNRDKSGDEVILFGEDCKTNPNIIGYAEMPTVPETDTWTPFEMTFNYSEDIDYDILAKQGYSLTVVFTSSTDGAYYEGAPGSTLCIDNVKIICE